MTDRAPPWQASLWVLHLTLRGAVFGLAAWWIAADSFPLWGYAAFVAAVAGRDAAGQFSEPLHFPDRPKRRDWQRSCEWNTAVWAHGLVPYAGATAAVAALREFDASYLVGGLLFVSGFALALPFRAGFERERRRRVYGDKAAAEFDPDTTWWLGQEVELAAACGALLLTAYAYVDFARDDTESPRWSYLAAAGCVMALGAVVSVVEERRLKRRYEDGGAETHL